MSSRLPPLGRHPVELTEPSDFTALAVNATEAPGAISVGPLMARPTPPAVGNEPGGCGRSDSGHTRLEDALPQPHGRQSRYDGRAGALASGINCRSVPPSLMKILVGPRTPFV